MIENKHNNDILYSKFGQAIKIIIQDLLDCPLNTKVKTVEEYMQMIPFSRGTLHNVLSTIETLGLATFSKHGQLGKILTSINYPKIFEFLEINNIKIIMPLPYSKKYESLATGIHYGSNDAQILVSILFARGSLRRANLLKEGVGEAAIVSLLSAKRLIKNGYDIDIIHQFKVHSYLNDQVLILSKANTDCDILSKKHLKVLCDKDSLDMDFLTKTFFRNYKNVEYINYSYGQILQALANNEGDAAFWNDIPDVYNIYGLRAVKNNDPKLEKYINDCSTACLITLKDNGLVNKILQKINYDKVEDIASQVLVDNLLPYF